MLFGFNGALVPVDYPQDWYEVNSFLKNDAGDFSVLFLPWHMYMDFSWVENQDKRIANPARVFFEKNVIQGDNVESGGIYSQSVNPVSKYIEFMMSKSGEIDNFGELVSILNVKYILLTKEVDWQNYMWLENQTDLELAMETENFLVFRNSEYFARIYQVDSVNYVRNLDEFLEESMKNDIRHAVYIFSEVPGKTYSTKSALDYVVNSPVDIRLSGIEKNYVIFSEPYSGWWRLGKGKPVENLGMTMAFSADVKQDNGLYYTKFPVHLVAYIISLACFIVVILYIRFPDSFKRRARTLMRLH